MQIRLFLGWDDREAEGFTVFMKSLLKHTQETWQITPLSGKTDGTNAFTLARFRVLPICHYALPAIFLDACDMLLLAPLEELAELYDPKYAVQVVKHDYISRHAVKYVGTEMEAPNVSYPRKNWSSVMIFNGGHPSHFKAHQEIESAIERGDGAYLHRFGWLRDEEIGELPIEWNWLPQEFGANEDAKLIHYTLGTPFMAHYENTEMSMYWHEAMTLHSER